MTTHRHPHPTLQVYGTPINHVTDFKYLGSMMASSASDVKRRKALAWTAFRKLERLWKSPSIPISTKMKSFNTTCITVLLYGSESWVISTDMENKINSFGTSCYRIMLNIRRIDRVPNAIIYSLTESAPPYWKSQTSTTEIPWSCAPLVWKWACQRFCNVCFYSWEEETRKTANLVHHLYSLSSGGPW